MLVLEIEACKHPRNDLKGCQRHRNNVSVQRLVLKCPSKTKNKVKFATHSAEKWLCMGNWERKNLAILFLKAEKAPDDRSFPQWVRYIVPNSWGKNIKKAPQRAMNNFWPLTTLFGLGQTSIALPISVH